MTVVSPSPHTPVTVVIPSYNEADNVEELIARLDSAFATQHAPARASRTEVLYVDDSTDDTPAKVREAAARPATSTSGCCTATSRPAAWRAPWSPGCARRAAGSSSSWTATCSTRRRRCRPCWPPSTTTWTSSSPAGYVAGGSLTGWPARGANAASSGEHPRSPGGCSRAGCSGCTDPMTGFFAVRTDRLDLGLLRPRGFKILLEVLASQPLFVEQVPLAFTDRTAGQSKATWRVGVTYLRQLLSLRFRNRMLRFAAVGALGTVANIALMVALMQFGVHYLPASIVAAEATILGNFAVQEVFVFGDLTGDGPAGGGGRGRLWARVATWFGFNNAELAVRTPMLVAVVETAHVPVAAAQTVLLGGMFLVRFVFTRYVVYRLPGRRRERPEPAVDPTSAG